MLYCPEQVVLAHVHLQFYAVVDRCSESVSQVVGSGSVSGILIAPSAGHLLWSTPEVWARSLCAILRLLEINQMIEDKNN